MSITPSIYVACLAAYNNGFLHGKWIDATLEPDEIKAEINKMLASSPIPNAEEYAIHDYEGFEDINISEYASVEKVQEFANFINNHGKVGADLYNHLGDLDEAISWFENNYYGFFDSVEDYARELTEDTTQIPENLSYYINYEAMARDMEHSGDILTVEDCGGVHVFWR